MTPTPPQLSDDTAWLYDEIMGRIEPDLLRDSIPHLQEKYRDETPEDREARVKRYEQSFVTFSQMLSRVLVMLKQEHEKTQRATRTKKEGQEKVKDETEVKNLESLFDDTAA